MGCQREWLCQGKTMGHVLRMNLSNQIKILLCITLCWLLYSWLYVFFKESYHSVISGVFALIGESGLDLLIAILSYISWKRARDASKIFFLFLMIAFISAFLSDFIYNYFLNIKQIKISTTIDSLFDVPFAVFLFFYMLGWFSIFIKEKDVKMRKIESYIPYVLASAIIFVVFVFGVNWKVRYSSMIGFYQIADTLFEVIGFLFASFCYIGAKKLWIKYISIGYLVVIGSDLIIRYSVVKNSIISIHPLEATWVFGLLMIVLGFFFLKEGEKMEAAY